MGVASRSLMFRLTRFLKSSNQLSEKVSFGKAGGFKDDLRLHSLLSKAGISTVNQKATSTGSVGDRVYADYTVFKGKAALCVSPRLPTFTRMDSGSLRVVRRGVMMLTFMPAIGERKYDWEKKQIFALSATEVGTLISLGPNSSCEFFHDPSMLTSNAGQVRKTLSVKPHGDGSGFFINLSVVNNLLKTNERFSVPVTAGEFTVIKTACSFALPHIMGWDQVTNKQQRATESSPAKVGGQLLDLEWDR